MNTHKVKILLAVLVLVAAALACSGSFSTANIEEAWMAADETGEERTTVFDQEAVIYAMVDLRNAPDDTTLKAVWTAVEAEDTDPDFLITETEFTSDDGLIHFLLENDFLWPLGKYKVDIYLNGELDQTLRFEVR
jgi:hypothetical protein